jgi:hypothetical protein
VTADPPNASSQLTAFIAAAATMRQQIDSAASAINGLGPPWGNVPPSVATAALSVTSKPVSAAIPAGMPVPLLNQTILVYSDLVARAGAFRPFAVGTIGNGPYKATNVTQILEGGAVAAARYPSDLQRLISLAKATPPFATPSPTARTTADPLILVADVGEANYGCLSAGGQVMTPPATVAWTPGPGATTGGIVGNGKLLFANGGWNEFHAQFVNGAWDVSIIAC